MVVVMNKTLVLWLLTTLSTVGTFFGVVNATTIRAPTYADYEELEQIIAEWAELTTCPTTNDPANPHWDWDDATGDCIYWPRERSPRPLLTRLVRHAFHDSLGEMDGFIDLSNPEHNGLTSSTIILEEIYSQGQFPSTGEPIKNALNYADLVAWAGIAGVRLTAMRQTFTGAHDDTDYVPNFPLKYGRKTYDAAVDGPHPTEQFPTNGPGGRAMDIETYFATNYGFTLEETSTIMGAHTLGGARPPESGYAGMWTQSKNHFDNVYYTSLITPEAIECTAAGACTLLDTPELCEEANGANRCLGWEQVPQRTVDATTGDVTTKFQWRHSCRDPRQYSPAQQGCTHLMLNVDMGLLRDIDDYICTDEKVTNGLCNQSEHGKIIDFPNPNPGNCVWGVDRVLATCFFERTSEISHGVTLEHAGNMNGFIDDFALVFDKMISSTRNPAGWPELTLVEVLPDEPIVGLGEPCPQSCIDAWDGVTNPWFCDSCERDLCGEGNNGGPLCRGPNWEPPLADGAANGEDCPLNTSNCNPAMLSTKNPFNCLTCLSAYCGFSQNPRTGQDMYKCRPINWTP